MVLKVRMSAVVLREGCCGLFRVGVEPGRRSHVLRHELMHWPQLCDRLDIHQQQLVLYLVAGLLRHTCARSSGRGGNTACACCVGRKCLLSTCSSYNLLAAEMEDANNTHGEVRWARTWQK